MRPHLLWPTLCGSMHPYCVIKGFGDKKRFNVHRNGTNDCTTSTSLRYPGCGWEPLTYGLEHTKLHGRKQFRL